MTYVNDLDTTIVGWKRRKERKPRTCGAFKLEGGQFETPLTAFVEANPDSKAAKELEGMKGVQQQGGALRKLFGEWRDRHLKRSLFWYVRRDPTRRTLKNATNCLSTDELVRYKRGLEKIVEKAEKRELADLKRKVRDA